MQNSFFKHGAAVLILAFLPVLVFLAVFIGACETDNNLSTVVDPVSFKITTIGESFNSKWGILKIRDGLGDGSETLARGAGSITGGEVTGVLKDNVDQSLNWHIPGDYYLTAEIYSGDTKEKTYLYVNDQADQITGWNDVNKVPKFTISKSKTYTVSSNKLKEVTEFTD
jgi:hypothetical protein